MQKERKVLTAFRWQSDGWAGRLEGKCSRGLLSGHTRAPFNKVQRWAAPQHIAGEWEEGEWGWREGMSKGSCVFSWAALPVMPARLGFLTCAWEQRLEILSQDRLRRGFRDLEEYLPSYAVTLWHPYLYMKEWLSPKRCTVFFFFASAVPAVCNVRNDHSLVVIQPISLIVRNKLIRTVAEDRQK